MANLLTRKLELFGPISSDDREMLDDVIRSERAVGSRQDIIREGDAPSDVHLVLDGFACRYKIMPDGQRQIFAYLVPGDFCDLNVFILKRMDHTIGTLSACRLVHIPRGRILELCERPAITRALWWVTLVDEATLREWLVSMGQRDADERIAHLFCELHLRLQSIGLIDGRGFRLPITQSELADTMGLSAVHTNRSLQNLRRHNLIEFKGGLLSFPDIRALHRFCAFDPSYLHLDGGRYDVIDKSRRP